MRLQRLGAIGAVVLAACHVLPEPELEGPCSDAALVEIEASYVAAVVAACREYETPEECPAYPVLRAEAERRRKEWVECR